MQIFIYFGFSFAYANIRCFVQRLCKFAVRKEKKSSNKRKNRGVNGIQVNTGPYNEQKNKEEIKMCYVICKLVK